jgi:hypothetical protein
MERATSKWKRPQMQNGKRMVSLMGNQAMELLEEVEAFFAERNSHSWEIRRVCINMLTGTVLQKCCSNSIII